MENLPRELQFQILQELTIKDRLSLHYFNEDFAANVEHLNKSQKTLEITCINHHAKKKYSQESHYAVTILILFRKVPESTQIVYFRTFTSSTISRI